MNFLWSKKNSSQTLLNKHERDCHSRANERDGVVQNGRITEINETRFLQKILLMTVLGRQMRMGLYWSLTVMNEVFHLFKSC